MTMDYWWWISIKITSLVTYKRIVYSHIHAYTYIRISIYMFLCIHCLGIFFILPDIQSEYVCNLKFFSGSITEYYLPGPLQLAEDSGWCDWSPLVVSTADGTWISDISQAATARHGNLNCPCPWSCAEVVHKQIGVFLILCSWCPKHFPWYIGNRLENHPLGLLEIILVVWRQLEVCQILILQKSTAPVVNNAFIWCYESHWIFSLVGADGGVSFPLLKILSLETKWNLCKKV